MTTVEASTDEAVGSLMRRIQAHIGPDAYLSAATTGHVAMVFVHHLDPHRFPAHKINQAAGHVAMSRSQGVSTMSVLGNGSLLDGLRRAAAWLELPDGE